MRAHRNPLRTPLLVAVGMLGAFVAAEAAAAALAPYLSEPDRYGDRSRAVKAAQIEDLASCVDVLVAGNSMARDGFLPEVFTDADPAGRSAYNAALDAASPELTAAWLEGGVLSDTRPATVLLTISSADLNAGSPAAASALGSWETSVAGAPGILGDLERLASEHLALIEHRRELRDPVELGEAIGAAVRSERAERTGPDDMPGVLGPRGEGRSRQDLTTDPDAEPDAFVTEQILGNFDLGDDPSGRVADLIRTVAATGAEPVVVLLPVTPAFAGAHPRGEADLEAAADAARRGAEETGTAVVDMRGMDLPADAFADSHHLNRTGAVALSSQLPAALAEAGVETERCEP